LYSHHGDCYSEQQEPRSSSADVPCSIRKSSFEA
jgi:hypothetical protein